MALVSFEDLTVGSVRWLWDFGDGHSSDSKDPLNVYTSTGLYEVMLEVVNGSGCTGVITKDLFVAARSDEPVLEDQEICYGEQALLDASNSDILRVYVDEGLSELLYEGPVFETGPLERDTIYYVTNAEGDFESHPVSVEVMVYDELAVDISYQIDTTDLGSTNKVRLINASGYGDELWTVDGEEFTTRSPIVEVDLTEGINVRLSVTDGNGCEGTVERLLELGESPLPIVASMAVCPGSEVLLEPFNGTLFNFYRDSEGTDLLHRGSQLKVSVLDSDTILYVGGIDKGIESGIVSAGINVSRIIPEIIPTPLEISLPGDNVVQLLATPDGLNYKWYVNGFFQGVGQVKELSFFELGSHEIILKVEDSLGCYAYDTLEYNVRLITSLEEHIDPQFKIYPNPANNDVTLSLVKHALLEDLEIKLIDLTGSTIKLPIKRRSQDKLTFNISDHKKGVYIIQINASGNIYHKRLIIY